MKFDILKPQSITSTGKKAIQEDCMYPAAGEGTIHDKLFVMCDGAGEDGKGYTAAEYFSRTVADYFFQNTCPDEPFADEVLREALFAAKEKMEARCPDSLGTAFAIFYMHRHGCLAAHVGDCRIYHIRPQEKKLLYRSVDDNKLFSPSDNRLQEPVKAIITDVKYGDYFVMMTKGAHQVFTDNEIADIISEPVNDKTKLLRIVKMLGDATDNYSVNIIHVSGVMNEAIDESLPQNETVLMENYKEKAANKVVKPVAESNAVQNVAKTVAPAAAKAATPKNKVAEPAKPEVRAQQPERPRRSPVGSVVEEPIEQVPEEKPRKKREFPIVTVTALVIVALAVWAWFWGQGQKEQVEKEAPVEVKKKQEKDTFNIIKNEKLRPVEGEEKMKPEEKTEEQKKKEEEAKKQAEKAAEAAKAAENAEAAATPNEETPAAGTATPEQKPAPATPAEPAAQPVQTTPPPTTPAPAKDPNSVTPRPVIPEE